MKALVLVLAIHTGQVWADGVDLTYLPAPKLTPAEQTAATGIRGRIDARSVVISGMDAAALDSTIVNVTIDGKVYRMVGAKTNSADMPNVDSWTGEGGGASAIFARYNGKARGKVRIGLKRYEITQVGTWVGATIEVKAIPNPGDDVLTK